MTISQQVLVQKDAFFIPTAQFFVAKIEVATRSLQQGAHLLALNRWEEIHSIPATYLRWSSNLLQVVLVLQEVAFFSGQMALSFALRVAVAFNQSWLCQGGHHDRTLAIFTSMLKLFWQLFNVQTLLDEVMLGLKCFLLNWLNDIA